MKPTKTKKIIFRKSPIEIYNTYKNRITNDVKILKDLYKSDPYEFGGQTLTEFTALHNDLHSIEETLKNKIAFIFQSEKEVQNDIPFFNDLLATINEFVKYEEPLKFTKTITPTHIVYQEIFPEIERIIDMLNSRISNMRTIDQVVSPKVNQLDKEINIKLNDMKQNIDNLQKSIKDFDTDEIKKTINELNDKSVDFARILNDKFNIVDFGKEFNDELNKIFADITALRKAPSDINDLQQKVNDLEQNLGKLSDYVKKDELDDYVEKYELNDYVKKYELNDYVKKDDLEKNLKAKLKFLTDAIEHIKLQLSELPNDIKKTHQLEMGGVNDNMRKLRDEFTQLSRTVDQISKLKPYDDTILQQKLTVLETKLTDIITNLPPNEIKNIKGMDQKITKLTQDILTLTADKADKTKIKDIEQQITDIVTTLDTIKNKPIDVKSPIQDNRDLVDKIRVLESKLENMYEKMTSNGIGFENLENDISIQKRLLLFLAKDRLVEKFNY